ncbi:MAG: tripartite tricarboxylate transporter substrate binding protein [Lysobacteraceae bacterium]
MRVTSRGLFTGFLIALTGFMQVPAAAQETYPNHPIKIVVPFPPGGAVDALSRLVAEKISKQLGQPALVENKPGASGNIGAEMTANARPDGYTLLSSPSPPLVINQSLYPHLPFDPATFVAVTILAGAPNVLVAHPRLQADSAPELIAWATAHPGQLNYASTGSGGTPHITTEWFKSAANIQITHVPYQGVKGLFALLAGEVDLMFMNLGDALPYIRSGKIKALAVASEKPIAQLPGVATLAETIPGFVSLTWFGIVATPGTPPSVADKLSAAIAQALQLPDVAKWLGDRNLDPIGGSPAQTAAFLKDETRRWSEVIRAAHIKVD